MGRPKSESVVALNYDDIVLYLLEKKYPESLQGCQGQKANFRRTCLQYAIIDGVLHYKHRKHRNDEEG